MDNIQASTLRTREYVDAVQENRTEVQAMIERFLENCNGEEMDIQSYVQEMSFLSDNLDNLTQLLHLKINQIDTHISNRMADILAILNTETNLTEKQKAMYEDCNTIRQYHYELMSMIEMMVSLGQWLNIKEKGTPIPYASMTSPEYVRRKEN